MDPFAAVGVGLGAVSLAFQVFSGCLKGYEMIREAVGMPASFQHLRLRLRIEQTRLLNWGQKIGIIKSQLQPENYLLKSNRNLIIDILFEVQNTFRDCLAVTHKFDPLIPGSAEANHVDKPFQGRNFPNTESTLRKILHTIERIPQVSQRLEWAMIKQDKFAAMVEKLIGYNDTMESLLDRGSILELHDMQRMNSMSLLQVHDKIDELKVLMLAMNVKTSLPEVSQNTKHQEQGLDPSWNSHHGAYTSEVVHLANFKLQSKLYEEESRPLPAPISLNDITISNPRASRSVGRLGSENVWIEWKSYTRDRHYDTSWDQIASRRAAQLANLLSSPAKPKEFRSPDCKGFVTTRTADEVRFGFVYTKPPGASPNLLPISLLDLLQSEDKPGLTERIALAAALARCLLYLHSVNWLHKGIRSSNVVFFVHPGSNLDYSQPILSGFEYARPDKVGEYTEKAVPVETDDVYRHPDIVADTTRRSKKAYDIYGLGIVLVEIACWRSVPEIIGMPEGGGREARQKLKEAKGILTGTSFLQRLEGHAGRTLTQVIERCLVGDELGIGKDYPDAELEVERYEKFAKNVVQTLGDIRI